MRFLSLFSGIEAASAAWIGLGWECVGVAEIEPFPCKLLTHYYPDVPNLGSVTNITKEQIEALGRIDLVVGGFPCQDLSVAGKRKGLRNEDGSATRSGLFFTAMQIIEWANPRWVVVENVPGLFSSAKGADFASVVGELAGCEFDVPRNGWRNSGVAIGNHGLVEWVTLDAQFCRTSLHPRAVPQRRRRVFVIRDSGDWRSRPPLFLDSESLRGNPPPGRNKGEEIAPTIRAGAANGGPGHGARSGDSKDELIVSVPAKNWPAEITSTLNAAFGSKQGLENQHINEGAPLFVPAYAIAGNTIGRAPKNGGNHTGYDDTGSSYTLTKTDVHAVAFAQNTRDEVRLINGDGQIAGALAAQPGMKQTSYIAYGIDGAGHCLRSGASKADKPCSTTYVQQQMRVRRLTPLECERLMGYPDFYTNIPGASNTARYKALGNSMAVNSMRILGERIAMAESIL